MKRMLINATQPEELRVALVDGQILYDFDIEQIGKERKRSNIYKGRVSRIEKSLGAAFVEFGSEKHGFLPIKELAPHFFKTSSKNTIDDVLSQGQEIIVQVDKEERGSKGAVLSTFISLAGHYLVLMPNNPDSGGISRSIEGKARDEMKSKMNSLNVPEGMGLILRTAGEGTSLEDLNWDLEYLLNVWDAVQEAYQLKKAPFLIFKENDLISRSLRDFLREDITEVLIDSDEAYDQACEFSSRLMPDFEERIKRYDESIPLFTRYQIESQIETAYQREVNLISGGSVVIDQTEALVSIDINSAKSTSGSDIEETALKTNLEAAKEIAKQLRLRDMGGLIVIDFIDMQALKNKRKVEDVLLSSLSIDRAKVQVGRISRFGLLEMSRQRLRPSLQERWTQDISSLSTAVLRLIEEDAGKKKSGEVRAVVSSDMSVFLLNERRARINEIEEKTGVRIVVVSDPSRADNRFEVSRIKEDKKSSKGTKSYKIQEEIETTSKKDPQSEIKKIEEAAVNMLPARKPKRKGDSFFGRLMGFLTSDTKEEKKPKKKEFKKRPRPNKNRERNFSKTKGKTKSKHNNRNIKGGNKKRGPNSERVANEGKKNSMNATATKDRKADGNKTQKAGSEKRKPKEFKKSPPKKKTPLLKEKIKTDTTPEVIKEKKPLKSGKDWGQAANDPRKKST